MNRVIQDISNFIFVNDEPQKADIIFIPGGSNPEPSERAAKLWIAHYAPLILPSGKYGLQRGRFPGTKSKENIYDGTYETEWDFMKDVLVKSGVDETAVLLENQASERGTLDNAFFSKNVTDTLGLKIDKAIICCKSFHARRCLMTYAWAYPDTEFYLCPVDVDDISKNDWHTNADGIKRVLSELQKCGVYFKDAIPFYQ